MNENAPPTDAVLSVPDTTSCLDDRKLAYVHLSNGTQPKSPTSVRPTPSEQHHHRSTFFGVVCRWVDKEISVFPAKDHARNDASNRAEFLYSLAEKEKRRRLEQQQGHKEKNAHFIFRRRAVVCTRGCETGR